jgi:hypothetical protein
MTHRTRLDVTGLSSFYQRQSHVLVSHDHQNYGRYHDHFWWCHRLSAAIAACCTVDTIRCHCQHDETRLPLIKATAAQQQNLSIPHSHQYRYIENDSYQRHYSNYLQNAINYLSSIHHVVTSKCESHNYDTKFRRHRTIDLMHKNANHTPLSSLYHVRWNNPLGEGAFGAVYLGINKQSGKRVAVKKINKIYTDNETFQREMGALSHVREAGGHPNICGLHEHFDEGDYYYLILDLIRYVMLLIVLACLRLDSFRVCLMYCCHLVVGTVSMHRLSI